MWRDPEQPGDGDTRRPPKLKDVLGSRPCSDSHQTAQAHPSAAEIFRARAEARACLWAACEFDLHEVVDELQAAAERDGLIEAIGQDAVQAIMRDALHQVRGAS